MKKHEDMETTTKENLGVESVTNRNGLQDSCKRILQGNNAKTREALEQVFYIVRMFDDINEVRRRVKMVASALAEAKGETK